MEEEEVQTNLRNKYTCYYYCYFGGGGGGGGGALGLSLKLATALKISLAWFLSYKSFLVIPAFLKALINSGGKSSKLISPVSRLNDN